MIDNDSTMLGPVLLDHNSSAPVLIVLLNTLKNVTVSNVINLFINTIVLDLACRLFII